jgi:anhydro-N-acetylmuramic acid kinase
VSKLHQAIGLMSGTSLDGIDVAHLETDGENVVRPGPAMTFPYGDSQRSILQQTLRDAISIKERTERPASLALAEQQLTQWHIEAVESFFQKTGISHSNIDVIGFHGQTVIHRPEQRLTVQLGDGAWLANRLNTPVAFDLRADDVAAGGQGAPLVPVYHRALAAGLAGRPLAFVNIGGVSNVTWIGADGDLLAFDTGPGNALLDDWMKHHTGSPRDEGGTKALSGRVDEAVIRQFLSHPFFAMPGPKSLDRNSFAAMSLEGLSVADGAASLVAVTARSIALARSHMPQDPKAWIICGGGRHNRAIMAALQALLAHVSAAEEHALNGDSLEAEAWAYLAVRSLSGLPLTFPTTTGCREPVTGGILARP